MLELPNNIPCEDCPVGQMLWLDRQASDAAGRRVVDHTAVADQLNAEAQDPDIPRDPEYEGYVPPSEEALRTAGRDATREERNLRAEGTRASKIAAKCSGEGPLRVTVPLFGRYAICASKELFFRDRVVPE